MMPTNKLFRSVVTYRLCLYVCLQATIGRRKLKLFSSCRFLICGSIIYSQTNLKMYTCGCNVFTAEGPSERVTIVSAYRPIHCDQFNCSLQLSASGWIFCYLSHRPMKCREKCLLDCDSWVGFHYSIFDQFNLMREMECCLLVWVSSTSFQTAG